MEKREQVRKKLIKDCFGRVEGREHCCILSEDVCLFEEKCPFYKTRAQYEADRRKANEHSGRVSFGVASAHMKSVRCIETGKVYRSIEAAAAETNMSERTISNNLNGKRSDAGGLHFEVYKGK